MKSVPPGKSVVSSANNDMMKLFIANMLFFLLLLTPLSAQLIETPPVSDTETDVKVIEEESTAYNPANHPYPQVSMRPVSTDTWQKATDNLNYSDDLPKEEEEEAPRQRNLPNFDWNPVFWVGFAKIFSIIVLIGLVGLVIYQMVQSPSNLAVRANDGTPITFDNLDAYIQETDLERFLREALAVGNYNQAVRIYYLQIIKDLSQKEHIQWSREKTNRDYLREMRNHPLSSDFRSATLTYEEVWYGNVDMDQNIFSGIEGRMKSLLQKII